MKSAQAERSTKREDFGRFFSTAKACLPRNAVETPLKSGPFSWNADCTPNRYWKVKHMIQRRLDATILRLFYATFQIAVMVLQWRKAA
jgi:hypothetical protein